MLYKLEIFYLKCGYWEVKKEKKEAEQVLSPLF